MRRILLLVTLLFGYLVTSVAAAEEFYTQYEVDYVFDPLGQARVKQWVSLTNKKSGIYAASYQLTLTGDPPQNISGADSAGPLKITTSSPQPDRTEIRIDFNDQVVGLGKSLKFNLQYTGRPAVHNGQVWEISLPKIDAEEIDEYQLRLTVPKSFGQLAFISPSPTAAAAGQYTFTKNQLTRAGVIAAFGDFQTFDFKLTYQLDNPHPQPARVQVAIPADTNYQRLNYTAIDPQPDDMTVDAEGNWLATFKLAGQQNLTVSATGQAHLLAEPTRARPGLTATARAEYLKSTPYWPSDNPQIAELANRLKTAENIYNYVVSTLKYDYDRAKPGVVRKGAVEALKTPNSSICTEFTDLFIALARAAGIPTREVNGFAYTTDKKLRPLSLVADIFHAWPQYWDDGRQTWVSVDPTWGNTTGGVDYFNKLDFNHFAFITRGISDTQPAITTSDTNVSFGSYTEFPAVTPQVDWQPPRSIWPFLANRSRLTVTNPSGQALYDLPLTIRPTHIGVNLADTDRIDILPPFGQRSFDLAVAGQFWPDFSPKSLAVVVGDGGQDYNIAARLFLPWQISLGTVTALIITALAWLATKAWSVYIQRRNRSLPVRGQG